MANEILKRDQNSVPVLAGVTDNASQEIRMFRVDPTTGRLLVSATGVGPGGSTGQVQFNDGGVFGTDNNFLWDKTYHSLLINTAGDTAQNNLSRIWVKGTGDVIDFGEFPSSFGVLGNGVVGDELGLLTGNDEFIAVRRAGAGSSFLYGNQGTVQISSSFLGGYDNMGIGIGQVAPPQSRLEVKASSGRAGTGTISSDGGGNVTGSGTLFLTELSVGDILYDDSSGVSGVVSSISSNTAAVTFPDVGGGGDTFTIYKPIIKGITSLNGTDGLWVGALGNVGINTSPYGDLHIYQKTANGLIIERGAPGGEYGYVNNGNARFLINVDILGNPNMELHRGSAGYSQASALYWDWVWTDGGDYDFRWIMTGAGLLQTGGGANLAIGQKVSIGTSVTPTAYLHLVAGTTAATTAPLKFNTGSLMTATEAGAVEFLTDLLYFTRTTGAVRETINATTLGRLTGKTAAQASVVTFTPPSDGSFIVSANVLVTTATLHNFTVTCAYTDEGNTARTMTLPFSVLAGTFVTAITNASGTVPYEGIPAHIRVKGGTAITVATVGTFTTVTYNVEGSITQIA